MRTMTAIAILLVVLALMGCAPDEATDQQEANDQQASIDNSARKHDGETRLIEQRREQLREAMREHREAAQDTAASDVPRRSIMRRDLGQTPWWQDEAIVAELGLDRKQLEAIELATADHRQAQVVARQEMAELRRQMSRSLEEGDSELATRASDQRRDVQRKITEADERWEHAITEILDAAQLEELATEYPEALSAPHARTQIRTQSR